MLIGFILLSIIVSIYGAYRWIRWKIVEESFRRF